MRIISNGRIIKKFMGLLTLIFLTSCASTERSANYRPHYKVGKPYAVAGKWYHPQEYQQYKNTGVASWYGKPFHGRATANGEVYNQNSLTAAHPTLPLPSVVRVTNLENGSSVILRVNDRGPFAKNRIIDVSSQAAKVLGFYEQGTARVKVELLPNESAIVAKQIQIGMLRK